MEAKQGDEIEIKPEYYWEILNNDLTRAFKGTFSECNRRWNLDKHCPCCGDYK